MKSATVLMLVLVLFGCDRTTRVEEPRPPPESEEREEVPATPIPLESADSSGPEGALPPQLDLTLPAGAGEPSEPKWTVSEPQRLPDLFARDDGDRAERRLSIGGRLLLKEDEPDYSEAVQGGEIRIKLKTR